MSEPTESQFDEQAANALERQIETRCVTCGLLWSSQNHDLCTSDDWFDYVVGSVTQ